MKRILTITLSLALVISLMAGGTVWACGEKEAEPTPAPAQGDFLGCCSNKFKVIMFYMDYRYVGCYDWVEPFPNGMTLAEPVSKEATFYYKGKETYKLEMPEGTVVESYFGGRTDFLKIEIIGGKPVFSPNLKLSKPATLYKMVDGKWVEVVTFTQVYNGVAS